MLTLNAIGNLGKDAESRQSNGSEFVSFILATNKRIKQQDGTVLEATTWLNCTYRNKALVTYLTKGSKIFIEGEFSVKNYKNKDGENIPQINVSVNRIELLDTKKSDNNVEAATTIQTESIESQLSNIPNESGLTF